MVNSHPLGNSWLDLSKVVKTVLVHTPNVQIVGCSTMKSNRSNNNSQSLPAANEISGAQETQTCVDGSSQPIKKYSEESLHDISWRLRNIPQTTSVSIVISTEIIESIVISRFM